MNNEQCLHADVYHGACVECGHERTACRDCGKDVAPSGAGDGSWVLFPHRHHPIVLVRSPKEVALDEWERTKADYVRNKVSDSMLIVAGDKLAKLLRETS